jgi:Tol biopolymer transport system component
LTTHSIFNIKPGNIVLPMALLACMSVITACSKTSLVSVSSSGEQGDAHSVRMAISGDGRYVAFDSSASNLVQDPNGIQDVFLRDTLMGTTIRVSVNNAGNHGSGSSSAPAISADGRYVAFKSIASDLVDDDFGGFVDIFVHDRITSVTTRASVDSAGNEGNNHTSQNQPYPAISANGRYVVFGSRASNMVADDTNGHTDVFVHDRVTGVTSRVSVDSAGNEANSVTRSHGISDDGRYVVMASYASNLISEDNNALADVFVHDRTTAVTNRVSVSSEGNEGNAHANDAAISGNGRYVVFHTDAGNLVANDNNDSHDIFLHDRQTSTTSRVSIHSSGAEGNGNSLFPKISADGRYISFFSYASNLVPDDTNGAADVFVHDQITSKTVRVNRSSSGVQANSHSSSAALSGDGRYVVFSTRADNLVEGDANRRGDIVIRTLPTVTLASVTPDQLPIGATTSLTISGSNFLPGTVLLINGDGHSLSNFSINDENTITVDVTLDASASAGEYNLVLALPGTGAGVFTGSTDACISCLTYY